MHRPVIAALVQYNYSRCPFCSCTQINYAKMSGAKGRGTPGPVVSTHRRRVAHASDYTSGVHAQQPHDDEHDPTSAYGSWAEALRRTKHKHRKGDPCPRCQVEHHMRIAQRQTPMLSFQQASQLSAPAPPSSTSADDITTPTVDPVVAVAVVAETSVETNSEAAHEDASETPHETPSASPVPSTVGSSSVSPITLFGS